MRPARGLPDGPGSRRANWSAGYERWWSSEPPERELRARGALGRQLAQVGDRHDRRGAEPAVAGGHVEVELGCPAVAEPLVQGDGAGHEAGRVEREHRCAALAREAL